MRKIKYIGIEGGTSKAALTKGKDYIVEHQWEHTDDFVIIVDDCGDLVDAYLPMFEEIVDV